MFIFIVALSYTYYIYKQGQYFLIFSKGTSFFCFIVDSIEFFTKFLKIHYYSMEALYLYLPYKFQFIYPVLCHNDVGPQPVAALMD